jgi:alpha-L-fucosidase 2
VRCGISDTRPAAAWQDAFLAGNGRHGAMVFGDTRDETVVITHHQLVRPNGSQDLIPPPLATRLEAVRDLLLAGKSFDALEEFCAGWPENAPQPFHPAFAIRLRLLEDTASGRAEHPGKVTGYRRTAGFRTGLLTTRWRDAAGSWRRTCFVSRARDVVVQRLQFPPDWGGLLEVEHDVFLPGAPPGLGLSWQGRVGGEGGAAIGLTVRYPGLGGTGGLSGYCGITRIDAPGGDCLLDGPLVRIRGTREVMLLTRVAPVTAQAGPEAGLSALTGQADLDTGLSALAGHVGRLPGEPHALVTEHTRLHRRAFGKIFLDCGASPADRRLPVAELLRRQEADPGTPLPALLEKLFASGRYLLLSASGALPPRLPGLWQGDWHAAWSGAIVANANLNLQLAGAVTTHVPAAIHALADLAAAQLGDWQVNASRLYGVRGILAPAASDGSSGLARHFGPGYPHHMWTAGADWLLVPLIEYADATGDEAFLRERVLPVATELALFYEDFLARSSDDGRAVFVPSYSPENCPAGWSAAAVNATMDIAAARHALTTAADVCARTGTQTGPGEGIERWQALAARLPRYRVNEDGALAEWAWPPHGPPVGDSYDHRHVSHLYPVWPLHEVTVDDTPALAEAALRALRLRGPQDGSAHGYLHRALAAARLHDARLAGGQLAAVTGGGFFFRSLMSSHYPGRRVYNADAACCLPGVLAEMLVDSVAARGDRAARIELLPAVPGFLRAGRLRGLRTAAQVRVGLSWDLDAGTATIALRSRIAQPVELTWRPAIACSVKPVQHGEPRASATSATGASPSPDAAPISLRPGSWQLNLTPGVPVRVTMNAQPHGTA